MVNKYQSIAGKILSQALDFFKGTRTMACLFNLGICQWWLRNESGIVSIEILHFAAKRIANIIQGEPHFAFLDLIFRPTAYSNKSKKKVIGIIFIVKFCPPIGRLRFKFLGMVKDFNVKIAAKYFEVKYVSRCGY